MPKDAPLRATRLQPSSPLSVLTPLPDLSQGLDFHPGSIPAIPALTNALDVRDALVFMLDALVGLGL